MGGKKIINDEDLIIKAKKYCWESGVFIYPVVHQGKGKKCPDVKIQMRIGNRKVNGQIIYSQKDKALYEKIDELYLDQFSKRND